MTVTLKLKNKASDCGEKHDDTLPKKKKKRLILLKKGSSKLTNDNGSVSNQSISENDFSSSAEKKKKPLHLQIVEDGTCSSSDYEGHSEDPPSSTASLDNIHQPSPQKTGLGSTVKENNLSNNGVPVSSEREDIGLQDHSNMHDEQNISSKSINIHRGGRPPGEYSGFVPLGDELTQEGTLRTVASSSSEGHDMDTTSSITHETDTSKSTQGEISNNLNFKPIGSNSSTPDLTSMIQCTDEIVDDAVLKEKQIQLGATTTATSRVVSVSSTEKISKYEDSNTSKSSIPQIEGSTSKESLGVDVASALDQVLAELEDDKGKHKENGLPCKLQQSLVDYSESSGTLTPNEDVSESGKSEDNKKSLHVESSMLLPEDSLNAIAEMTVGIQSKKDKRSSDTLGQSPSDKMGTSNSNVTTPNIKKYPSTDSMTPHIVPPPPHESLYSNKKVSPTNATKSPMILGTAAAQLHIINQSSPKSDFDTQSPKNKHSPPKTSQSNENVQNNSVGLNKKEEKIEQTSNGWEQGMSMLADIISSATPMRSNSYSESPQSQSGKSNKSNNTMVPVGQSLRLYSSIAAQAGVASYSPTKLPEQQTPIAQQPQQRQRQDNQLNQTTPSVASPMIQQPKVPECYVREIGKIRRYNAATSSFGEWEDLPFQTYGDSEPRRWCDLNIDESIEIPLLRGGRLRVFPNFLGESRRVATKNAMENCQLYRQYSVFCNDRTSLEPRLQVLLSSQGKDEHYQNNVEGVGYVYKGVSMKAKPISREPQIHSLSTDLAELYRLPNKEWSIGANLVYYRDGNDHTTWHSDDTQGEQLILCIVVDSESHARPVLVKPKTKTDGDFQDGDEEIIIFVGQGDAYEMDGEMQMNYEHCLPMKHEDMHAKRSAIIFRYGNTAPVTLDTGTPLIRDSIEEYVMNQKLVNSQKSMSHFGHVINGNIREGKKLYTKGMLVSCGAHRHDKKHVSGSIRDGCESILIESQNRLLREDDGLCWFQITCTKNAGGGALCQSYHTKSCIRVFRSSELDNKYAPDLYEGEDDEELYRYDGLYTVRAMWDPEGAETEYQPEGEELHTFFLMRQPKRPADSVPEDGVYYNKISLQELWNEIQKRRGVRKPKLFAVPEPIMDVGRIGDKNNARKRPASTRRTLNTYDNTVDKQVIKKKNVNVIPISNYSVFAENNTAFHYSNIYSSDSDLSRSDEETDSEEDSIDSANDIDSNSANESTRPRRKSAAVARTYLKEVMHNRYGDTQQTGSIDKNESNKRSIWSTPKNDDENINNRRSKNDRSGEEELSNYTPEVAVETSPAKQQVTVDDKKITKNANKGVNEADEIIISEQDLKRHDSAAIISTTSNNQKTKDIKSISKAKPAKRRKTEFKSKQELQTSSTVNENVVDVDDDNDEQINLDTIQEGSRVHVEYRNTLFKATVKKVRSKNGSNQCLIHYDGNKKSNVHWISFSLIREILDDPGENVQETQPKGGRKRKSIAPTSDQPRPIKEQKLEHTNVIKESVSDEEDKFKFLVGSDVYVDYKKVLYLSTVLKSRKTKKGNIEYYVHYDGFKKTSDRWMKESSLVEINASSTKRFRNERGVETTDETNIKNRNKGEKTSSNHLSKKLSSTKVKMEIQTANTTLDMSAFDSGVEFLPGSCVFIAKGNALYLAKMLKRRKTGKGMEYCVQFDGMSADHNEWISLSNIYELNPKTRKIYEQTADERIMPEEEDDESSSSDEEDIPASKPTPKSASSKTTSKVTNGKKGPQKKPQTSRLFDMKNIEPGVDFLPGSTLFVQWKNGLYLGKMLKKRGKGEDMEYLIHYDGYKSSQDQWVSVSMVFEINPQTKRAFNKQKKDKK